MCLKLATPFSGVSIVDFEQMLAGKLVTLFRGSHC